VHRREVEPGGSLVEIKIWRVPKNPRQPYGFKYSLVYIASGKRVLGYDNAHGRDHRHLRGKGYSYEFVSPAKLMEDFLRDLTDIREETL
jgi:Family of unknown function (DUF6516)